MSIQLEIHRIGSKGKELNRIGDSTVNHDLITKHKINKLVTSINIVFAIQCISACIGLSIFAIWIYAALEVWAWINGL